eukprot:scaffold13964_cov117-Isochrysis_galbana.AAC.2
MVSGQAGPRLHIVLVWRRASCGGAPEDEELEHMSTLIGLLAEIRQPAEDRGVQRSRGARATSRHARHGSCSCDAATHAQQCQCRR